MINESATDEIQIYQLKNSMVRHPSDDLGIRNSAAA
jgi:hypothetical protein